MLNKTKERIAIFFNEKSEARKYGKELRAEEDKKHESNIAVCDYLASRPAYRKRNLSEQH